MIYSESKAKLIPALMKARASMSSGAKKNTNNAHLKSSYANLESFLAAIRPALEANDLMIMQSWEVGAEKNFIYLNTTLMHISGESVETLSPFPITKPDAHGVGSAITYARRYAIAAMFGIAQSDDDGNATRKTSTDVVKSIQQADSVEALQEIYRIAREPHFFGNDPAAMRVISAAYNEKKASFVKIGDGFKPTAIKKNDPQPEDEPKLAEPSEPATPGDFSNF